MTINNNTELSEFCNCNEYNLNLLTRTHWRASLVPAAAVIPAPIAYIKVVAVKKLVVGLPGPDPEWGGLHLCRSLFSARRACIFPKTARALH